MKFSLVIALVVGIIQCQEVFGCGGGSRRRPRPPPVPVPRPRPPVPPGGSKCFEQICASNPSNQIRGRDPKGSGYYGASRAGGTRRHKGIDIVCTAGSRVYSPFPAKVVGLSIPYKDNNQEYNTGIRLTGTGKWTGYTARLWYVKLRVRIGTSLQAGAYIGDMLNRASTAPGMTNHVHVELRKNGRIVNPTSYNC